MKKNDKSKLKGSEMPFSEVWHDVEQIRKEMT
jgi:hypothetical protein